MKDDSVALSSHALAALQEFLTEQQQQQDAFDALQKVTHVVDATDAVTEEPPLSMDLFQEDWQLSQFWYDNDTARTLAEEAVRQAGPDGMIACISAPSTFTVLKKMRVSNPLLLLEYDTRFAAFKDEFRRYDYNRPSDVAGLALNGSLRGTAAVVLLDPPFLNDDCFTKMSETAKLLGREDAKFIAVTGWVMRNTVREQLNACLVDFRPRHRGGLANAFRCYVNYRSNDTAFALSTDPEDGNNDFLDQ